MSTSETHTNSCCERQSPERIELSNGWALIKEYGHYGALYRIVAENGRRCEPPYNLKEAEAFVAAITPDRLPVSVTPSPGKRISLPYGLEGFRLEAHGDEEGAVLETEGGQWSVAVIDSSPEHADFDEPSPWSSLAMAEYLAKLHNENITSPAESVVGEGMRGALERLVRASEARENFKAQGITHDDVERECWDALKAAQRALRAAKTEGEAERAAV